MVVRKIGDVPEPNRRSGAVQAQQDFYDELIQRVGHDEAGELELAAGETLRSVKMLLTRSATRLKVKITHWDVNGR